MSEQVTISSISANLPVNIYYCDSMSANCVFVSAVTEFPYSFVVPPPYSDVLFVVKIVDSDSCELGKVIYTTTNPPTPTVTSSLTQTPVTKTPTTTQTPTTTPLTQTPTKTCTPTITLTKTVTKTPRPSRTPTQTQTPTSTITPTIFISRTPICVPSSTPSNTPTNTQTPTQTPTNTQTPTQT